MVTSTVTTWGPVICYTRHDMFKLRKQPVLAKAVAACKEVGIFKYRGTRGGKGNRNRPCAVSLKQDPPEEHRIRMDVLLINARSINNKADELDIVVDLHRPSVIGLTETWLNDLTPDMAICPAGYTVFRTDRPRGRRGGGVALMVDQAWTTQVLECHGEHPACVECVVVSARKGRMPREASTLIFHLVYVPPIQQAAHHTTIAEHLVLTYDMLKTGYPCSSVIILGDMNNARTSALSASTGLKQVVMGPTRGERTLDQVWTSLAPLKVEILPPLGKSDHGVVKVQLGTKQRSNVLPNKMVVEIRPKYQTAMNECGEHLSSMDWGFIVNEDDIDEKDRKFAEFMYDLNEDFFPTKRITIFPNSKPWFNGTIYEAIKLRDRCYERHDPVAYREAQCTVKRLILEAKERYYRRSLASLRVDEPRQWFKGIKRLGRFSNVTTNQPAFTPEALNQYFVNIGRDEDDEAERTIFAPKQVPRALKLEHYETANLLKSIRPHKSQPDDDIPAGLLKDYYVELAEPVTGILNASLQSGKIPTRWSTLTVTPIPKVKAPAAMSQWRPIVKACILFKILDTFVAGIVRAALRPILDGNQFGGVKGLSTTHYLLLLLHFIHHNVDLGRLVAIQAVDIEKAFNSVVHELLLSKVDILDLLPQIYNWIGEFLTRCTQVVKVKNVNVSPPLAVTRGVPQGTSLAPTLFTLFVNDLPQSTTRWGFVDDITNGGAGDTSQIAVQDCQTALDSLGQWLGQNQLTANAEKSRNLIFNFSRSRDSTPLKTLCLLGQVIPTVSATKILGVIIQDDLKWGLHIEYITNKARSNMFLLKNLSMAGLPPRDLKHVYVTVIRPILEYACPIWNAGLTRKESAAIESVQKWASYLISRRWGESYETICQELDLPALEARRETLCLKFAKSLIKDGKFAHIIPPINASQSIRSSRRPNHLMTVRYNTERMRSSPVPYLCRLYNSNL